jgi:hypothetical protein
MYPQHSDELGKSGMASLSKDFALLCEQDPYFINAKPPPKDNGAYS